VASEFAAKRYVMVEQLVSTEDRKRLFRHALQRLRNCAMHPDRQVPGSPAAYGDPHMEELLEHLCPRVERITGLKLFPTYSYWRAYHPGAVLARHTDRPSCEISVTVNLGQRARHPWPIWIEGAEGAFPVVMKPGDAAVYRGIECPHWRKAFEGQLAMQAFLHYVDRNGPYAKWKFDQRGSFDDKLRSAEIT
jgi:hypothetical protein